MEIIRKYFSEIEIDEIYNEICVLEKEKDRKDYIRKYYEKDNFTINRIEYFVNYNKYLKQLALRLGARF